MILIRYILIGLIIYLLIRSFARYWTSDTSETPSHGESNNISGKGVSKDTGEYVDYEEVD